MSSIDLEKPEQSQTQDFYYGDYIGVSADSSSKYPFYVELDDSEGLMLGQHVYIIIENGFNGSEWSYEGEDGIGYEEGYDAPVFDNDGGGYDGSFEE